MTQTPNEETTAPKFLIDSIADEDKPKVELVGQDGNSMAVIGRVTAAWKRMRRYDVAQELVERVRYGDRNNLLNMAWLYCQEVGLERYEGDDEDFEDEDEDEDYVYE